MSLREGDLGCVAEKPAVPRRCDRCKGLVCGCSENKAANTHADEATPEPYCNLFHPHKTWVDVIVSLILYYLVPVASLTNHPVRADDDGTRACLQKVRSRLRVLDRLSNKSGCQKWSKLVGGLAECTVRVPRRVELLSEWGLIEKDDAMLKTIVESTGKVGEDSVECIVRGPASVLLPKGDDEQQRHTTETGCVAISEIDWGAVPTDVPVLLWCHGGGLVVGQANDSQLARNVDALLQHTQTEKGGRVSPLVVASIEYRLAPEHPFPLPQIDVLSVAAFFLESNSARNIHLGGTSAGGYLTTVTAFACHSVHPTRVKSAFVQSAMLSPTCDTRSFALNATSSSACPVDFLRWCWRATLEDDEEYVPSTDTPVVRDMSYNRWAWENKCKWRKTDTWRNLVEPIVGIPSDIASDNSTRFVVAVNKGDPLHDEGMELVAKLEDRGASVTLVDATGSHVVGYSFDNPAFSAMLEAWRSSIWD